MARTKRAATATAKDSPLPGVDPTIATALAPHVGELAGIMSEQVKPRPEIVRVESRKSISIDPKILESMLRKGDLSELNTEQRVAYYNAVCESVGLNPLTRPFEFILLNGKLVLYARRDCTDQLRTVRGVSVTSLDAKREEGLCIVIANVKDKGGRTDSATGAVSVEGLRGEALANALMKAETKAKRRATLSLCGLGMLDESEIESVPVHIEAAPVQTVSAGRMVSVATEGATQEPRTAPQEAPREEKLAGVPRAEKPPESNITGKPTEVVPTAPTPAPNPVADGYARPPATVPPSIAPNVKAMKSFLFGKPDAEDRLIEYLFFAIHPMVTTPVVIERNGRWNPELWKLAMTNLGDRLKRMSDMEDILIEQGKEGFVKWATAIVEAAKARKIYVAR